MSYKALYRTYRPSSFDDVVGQKHVVSTLKNAVKQNKIAHAYLFCGPRGTGKTSIAKLLAKAVNCQNTEKAPCGQCVNCKSIQLGNHPDIVEIDAASNNGVDEIRDLIEKVKYAPIEGKYKVYIIDEVHMLSTGAFNALLKTLEEPPSHIIFVLATTEPHKVLPTIISRCQRYDFTKVEESEMVKRIQLILQNEKIQCEEEAIRLITTLADGGMRDALSILDQCIAYAGNNIKTSHVNEIYGITTTKEKLEILDSIFIKDARTVLNKIKIWSEKGIDIRRLTADLIEILKESVIYGYTKDENLLVKLKKEETEKVLSNQSTKTLLDMIQILMETTEKYRTASNVTSYFEVATLKMIGEITNVSNEKLEQVLVKKQEITEVIKKEPIIEKENIVKEEVKNELEVEEDLGAQLIIQEVKPKKIEIEEMSVNDIVRLMVQAVKQEKLMDVEKWKLINEKCRELSCARYANTLKETSVAVSGYDFILISSEYSALTNEINEMKSDLEKFLWNDLNIKKVLFVTTKNSFIQATEEFIERRKSGTLPEPLPIQVTRQNTKEKEVDKNLEQMMNLFGNDFEIINEEE